MTHVPATSPREPESPTTRSRFSRRAAVPPGRTVVAIALAFIVFLLADLASTYLLIAAAFGSPAMLWGIVVVAAVTATFLIFAVTILAGSRRIVGPIVATVVTAITGGLALVMGELTPMLGEPATPAAHFLICAGGALVLGLFLGPWPFRVIGGIAAISVVVYGGLIAPPLPQDNRQPATGNRQEIEANFEYFLDNGTRPLVPDDSDWEVAYLDASGGPATSVIVSPGGRATTVVVDNTQLSGTWDADAFACWQLTDRYTSPDTETTFADWSDVCVKTADGWEALDGSGFGWDDGGALILVMATRPNEFDAVAGVGPARMDEMRELRGKLRPMTKDEMREEFTDNLLGPNG